MSLFIFLLIIALASAHLTKVLSESYITQGFREWVLARNGFIGYGVNCFFCTSTWVSVALSFLCFRYEIMPTLILGFSIAALANLIRNFENGFLLSQESAE